MSTDTFQYPAPIFTSGTLRLNHSEAEIFSENNESYAYIVLPATGASFWLTFDAQHLGPVEDDVLVTYSAGNISFECTTDFDPLYPTVFGKITDSRVICRTQTGEPSGTYYFSVTVGGQSSLQVDDQLIFPSVPIITHVSGCPITRDQGTFDCPTSGGTIITLTGESFGQQMEVTVADKACTDPVFANNELTCRLPVGSGLVVSIAVTLVVDDEVLQSASYALIGYAAPSISDIVHADCTVDTNEALSGCPREGGGTLIIMGSNFASEGAVVIVGSSICGDLIHTIPSTEIQCTLPSGTTQFAGVNLIQSGGALSSSNATLGYLPCSPGTFQRNSEIECVPCQAGEYSSSSGVLACYSCPSGTYSDVEGQIECTECSSGFYQDQFGAKNCEECSSGSFTSATTTKFECSVCESGKMQPDTGQTGCDDCFAGKFKELAGVHECQNCSAGSYTSEVTSLVTCSTCPIGRYQEFPGMTACEVCSTGKFQNSTASSDCYDCARGSYNSVIGSGSCVFCEASKTQSLTGQSTCVNCDYGKYKSDSGPEECSDCPAGTYTSESTTLFACATCAAGKYHNLTAQTVCFDCDAGTAQDQEGMFECNNCSIGSYAAMEANVVCTECELGKAQSLGGQTGCEDCVFGKHQSDYGASECTACGAGTYTSDSTTLVTCAPCRSGRYQNATGQTDCDACLEGKYQFTPGAEECTDCKSGKYAASLGNAECSGCEAGRSQALAGQISCEPCEYGKYTGESGMEECSDCPAGSYTSDSTTLLLCATCAAGRYQNFTAQTECLMCDAGTAQDQDGMLECMDCEAGTYSSPGSAKCELCKSVVDFQPDQGQAECVRCPQYAISIVNRSTCVCEINYYGIAFGDILTFMEVDSEAYDLYKLTFIDADPLPDFDPNERLGFWCASCPEGADCSSTGSMLETVLPEEHYFSGVDGRNTEFFDCFNNACGSDGECAPGYSGPTCTDCDSSNGTQLILDDNFECNQCPSVLLTIAAMLVMMCLFIAYLAYKVHDVRQGYQAMDVFAKIMVSSFQVNSLALSYFDWDSFMEGFLVLQETTTTLGTAYLNFGCLSSSNSAFVIETITYFFAPFLIPCLIFAFSYGHSRILKAYRHPSAWKGASQASRGAIAVILFLLQPYLVTRCALVFSCVKMGAQPDDLFMSEDLSVRCWTSTQHQSYIFMFGLPLFLCYVIGVPAVLYYTLSNRSNHPKVVNIINEVTEDDDTVVHVKKRRMSSMSRQVSSLSLDNDTKRFFTRYAFLFVGYTEDAYYWEVVVLGRKALVSLIGVTLSFNKRLQGMMGLLIIFCATIAHVNQKPFIDPRLNLFEWASLGSAAATFFLGVFTIDAGSSGEAFEFSSLLAFIINVLFLLIAMCFGIVTAREAYNMHTLENNPHLEKARSGDEDELQKRLSRPVSTLAPSELIELEMTDISSISNLSKIQSVSNLSASPSSSPKLLTTQTRESPGLSPTTPPLKASTKTSRRRESSPALQPPSIVSSRRGTVDVTPSRSLQIRSRSGDVTSDKAQRRRSHILKLQKEKRLSGQDPNGSVTNSTEITDLKANTSTVDEELVLVKTVCKFQGKKAYQMSFAKGDLIQVIDSKGKWNRGILHKSTTYPITGKKLFYPPNFVQAL